MMETSSSRRRENGSRPATPEGRGLLDLPFAVGAMAVRQITAVVRIASEATLVPVFGGSGPASSA